MSNYKGEPDGRVDELLCLLKRDVVLGLFLDTAPESLSGEGLFLVVLEGQAGFK